MPVPTDLLSPSSSAALRRFALSSFAGSALRDYEFAASICDALEAEVSRSPGVLDPQGATVERALPALGYDNVSDVRIGKTIRHVARHSRSPTRAQVDEMCQRLLSNPVIEVSTRTGGALAPT